MGGQQKSMLENSVGPRLQRGSWRRRSGVDQQR
jgi:hypothetical protein